MEKHNNNPDGYEYAETPQSVGDVKEEVPADVLTDRDHQEIEEEIKKEKVTGLIQQIGGVLSALLLFFGTLNIEFNWLTQESIDAFVVVLAALAALGVSVFTTYKNSHSFKKGIEDNRKLKEAKLAEKRLREGE